MSDGPSADLRKRMIADRTPDYSVMKPESSYQDAFHREREAYELVRYCLRCEFKASASNYHIVARGLFAAMVCSGCKETKSIYVFALVRLPEKL